MSVCAWSRRRGRSARGLDRWEHSYATAPFKAAQVLRTRVLHRSNGILQDAAEDTALMNISTESHYDSALTWRAHCIACQKAAATSFSLRPSLWEYSAVPFQSPDSRANIRS